MRGKSGGGFPPMVLNNLMRLARYSAGRHDLEHVAEVTSAYVRDGQR
jgi:hypothetical protein